MSRESVVWDENTRAYIQKVIKDAQDEASKIIQAELKTDDFYTWLQRSTEIINQMSAFSYQETKLTILAKIVDKHKLQTKFPGDSRIIYKHNPSTFFKDIEVKAIEKDQIYKNGKYKTKINRDDVPNWGYFKGSLVYEMTEDERHSVTKDLYIQHLKDSNHFITVKKATDEQVKERIGKRFKDTQVATRGGEKITKKIKEEIAYAIEQRDIIWDALFGSDHIEIENYADIEVTDEFRELMKKQKEEAEEEEQEDKMANMTPKERREMLGKTVCYSFKKNPRATGYSSSKDWVLSKKEPVVNDLVNFDKPVIYGTSKDDDRLKALSAFFSHDVCQRLGKGERHADLWAINSIKNTPNYDGMSILRFSKRNLKHVRDVDNFIKVEDYLMQKTEDTYHIGEIFVKYFTGRKLKERLENIKFLRNFEQLDESIQRAYNFLYQYTVDHYSHYDHYYFRDSAIYKTLKENTEKAFKFQKFVKDANPTEDEIKAKAKLLFDNEDITEAKGIEIEVIELLEEVEAYAEPIKELMNSIPALNGGNGNLGDTSIKQLKTVIASEGLSQYKLTEEKQKLIQQDKNEEEEEDN